MWIHVANEMAIAAAVASQMTRLFFNRVCLPLPDGRYEVHIFEAIEPRPEQGDREVAQRVWDHFERAIREHPEGWLWMYKHWRYQPALGRDPAYPAYARVSGAFLDLLKELQRTQRMGLRLGRKQEQC
jgi:lauroyl/myristoyl acyltransferase